MIRPPRPAAERVPPKRSVDSVADGPIGSRPGRPTRIDLTDLQLAEVIPLAFLRGVNDRLHWEAFARGQSDFKCPPPGCTFEDHLLPYELVTRQTPRTAADLDLARQTVGIVSGEQGHGQPPPRSPRAGEGSGE